jgi:CheY-like chemotaxis protein
VLLVDDSDINLDVARRLLAGRGAQVLCCASGRQALDCLRAAPTGFDAVLMDVQMPDMDGLEATRRVRADLGLLRLPVIALTAGALVEERRRAFDAGMQGFLPKPLDPAQLVRVLRGCVETARGAVLPVAGLACQPRDDLAHWPRVEGIDTADAAQRLGRDPALFVSLLRQLLAEFQDLAGLGGSTGAAAERRQWLAARMHKLRGGAGTLGARDLQRLAQAAEASLRLAVANVDAEADAVAAVHSVSRALARLASDSVALLADAASNPAPKPSAAGSTLLLRSEADRMQELQRQLQGQDLGALGNFEGLSPSLRQVLGETAFAVLSEAMQELDFGRALHLLAPVRPVAPDGPADGTAALTAAITD